MASDSVSRACVSSYQILPRVPAMVSECSIVGSLGLSYLLKPCDNANFTLAKGSCPRIATMRLKLLSLPITQMVILTTRSLHSRWEKSLQPLMSTVKLPGKTYSISGCLLSLVRAVIGSCLTLLSLGLANSAETSTSGVLGTSNLGN